MAIQRQDLAVVIQKPKMSTLKSTRSVALFAMRCQTGLRNASS